MKRKLMACVLAVVMFLALSTVSMADTVTLWDGPGSVQAGLFYADTDSSYLGDFGTFCLETTESISIGTTYNYTIETYAIAGGGGAVGGKDEISNETAYLYYQFRMGAYTIDDFEMSSLQVAFWILEEEYYGGLGVTAAMVARAKDFYIKNATDAKWTDIGFVRVMNLTDRTGNKQSVLTLVPEPMSLILLGLGLLGVGITRKLRK